MSMRFGIDNPMNWKDFARFSKDYNANLKRQKETEYKISDLNQQKSEVKRVWGASVNKKKKSSSFWISILAYVLLSAILYFVLVPNVVKLSGGVIFLWCAFFVIMLIIVYCINSGHENRLLDKIENRPELREKLTEEQKSGLIAAKERIEVIDAEINKKEQELQSLKDEEINNLFWVKNAWEETFKEYDNQLSREHPVKQYQVNGKTISVDMKKVLLPNFESQRVIDTCISQYLYDVEKLTGNIGTPRVYIKAAIAKYILDNQTPDDKLEAAIQKEIKRQL